MSYKKYNNVICIDDPKQSALYFDNVLPFSLLIRGFLRYYNGRILYNHETLSKNIDVYTDVIFELIGPKYLHNESTIDFINILNQYYDYQDIILKIVKYIVVFPAEYKEDILKRDKSKLTSDFSRIETSKIFVDSANTFVNKFKDKEYLQAETTLKELITISYFENYRIGDKFSTKSAIDSFSSIWKVDRLPLIPPSSCLSLYNSIDEDITITISKIPLVDTSKASWNQIVELRKDKEAIKKLRNLKLFLHTNYEKKDRSFIEDDLSKRLDDYEATCKDWGFETRMSSFSAVIDSKNLHQTFALSAGAAIFGEPILGAGMVIAGAFAEIGKVCIEIAKKKHAFNKFKRRHELAYIIEAKEKLGG
jgi:hypothetical protein